MWLKKKFLYKVGDTQACLNVGGMKFIDPENRPLSWRHESGYGHSLKDDRITSRLAEGGTTIVMAGVWP